MEPKAKQKEFDWTYAEKRGWLDNADIPSARDAGGRSVGAATLASVLNHIFAHLGNNAWAWPSVKLLAQRSKLSERQIKSAISALQNLSLLIVDNRKVENGTGKANHYKIVWSELALLDPAKRAQWMRVMRSNQGDIVPNQSDILPKQSDILPKQGDIVPYQGDILANNNLKETKENEKKTTTDHTADSELADSSTDVDWKLVVRFLLEEDVTAAELAVAKAQQRGLTPQEALQLIDQYRNLADDRKQPGWLYRWLTMRGSAPKPKPATSELPKQAKLKVFDETNALISITRQERASMIHELGIKHLFDQHMPELDRRVQERLRLVRNEFERVQNGVQLLVSSSQSHEAQ